MVLAIERCKLLVDTLAKSDVRVKKQYLKFLEFKKANPLEPFGASDSHLKAGLKEYRHAKLTPDISVFYQLRGNLLKVFGIYSHDDAGTGQPPNQNKQNSLATRFGNQEFFETMRIKSYLHSN